MEGITVLYQEPIYKIICVNENILNLLVIMFIVTIVVVIISAICLELKGIVFCVILGCIILFIMGILDSYSTTTEEIEGYEYKVTIDDSVPMKEFLSKYEIINQEGEIFTIVERENINEESKWYSK